MNDRKIEGWHRDKYFSKHVVPPNCTKYILEVELDNDGIGKMLEKGASGMYGSVSPSRTAAT